MGIMSVARGTKIMELSRLNALAKYLFSIISTNSGVFGRFFACWHFGIYSLCLRLVGHFAAWYVLKSKGSIHNLFLFNDVRKTGDALL